MSLPKSISFSGTKQNRAYVMGRVTLSSIVVIDETYTYMQYSKANRKWISTFYKKKKVHFEVKGN